MISKKAVAFHEAGHAVAAVWLTNHVPEKATIVPEGESAGHVLNSKEHLNRFYDIMNGGSDLDEEVCEIRILREIVVIYAAEYAQKKGVPGSWRKYHGGGDGEQVEDIVYRTYSGDCNLSFAAMNFCRARAEHFVSNPLRWKEIRSIAKLLLKKSTLTAEEIAAAIRGEFPVPPKPKSVKILPPERISFECQR